MPPIPLNDPVYLLHTCGNLGARHCTCFAAKFSGLFRSENGGRSWTSAFESLDLHGPAAVPAAVVSPDLEHEPVVLAGMNGGILRSGDGGVNWVAARVPSPPPAISAMAASPNFMEDDIVFASTMEDGVLFSSDCGATWAAWNFGLLDLNCLCLAISPNFSEDENLFVGTQSGIFRSTNGGRAWREVLLPVEFDAVLSLAVSPAFDQDGTVYAGTESTGLLRSTDWGKKWERLARSRLVNPINAILLSPRFATDRQVLALHGGTPLLSMDGGRSWRAWRKETIRRRQVTALLAPEGFGAGAAVLAGFANGSIELNRA